MNVLLQMGLMPTLESESVVRVHRYGSLDEAVDEFAHRMNRRDGMSDDLIRAGLLHLLHEEEGSYVLDYPAWQAHVWWKTAGQAISPGTGPLY